MIKSHVAYRVIYAKDGKTRSGGTYFSRSLAHDIARNSPRGPRSWRPIMVVAYQIKRQPR